MKKILLVCLAPSLFLGMLLTPSFAGAPDFKKCDELKGAAWGLCKGAIAHNCDNPANATSPGCTDIIRVVEQVTGQPAPTWTCPCGDANRFAEFIKSKYDKPVSCSTIIELNGDKILTIDTDKSAFVVFSFYPGAYPKQTCGFDRTSLYSITDDEASACVSEIRATAEIFGLRCF